MTKLKIYLTLGVGLLAFVIAVPFIFSPLNADAAVVNVGGRCYSQGQVKYGANHYGTHSGHSKYHLFKWKYTCSLKSGIQGGALVWKVTGTNSHSYNVDKKQCTPGKTETRSGKLGVYSWNQKRVCSSSGKWGAWKDTGSKKDTDLKAGGSGNNNNDGKSSGGNSSSGSSGSSSKKKAHANTYKPEVTTTLNSSTYTQGDKIIVTNTGKDADNDKVKIRWQLVKPDGKTFTENNFTRLRKSGYSWVTAKSGGLNLTDRRIFKSWANVQVGTYTIKTEICDEHGSCRFGKDVKFTVNPGKSNNPGTSTLPVLKDYAKPTAY